RFEISPSQIIVPLSCKARADRANLLGALLPDSPCKHRSCSTFLDLLPAGGNTARVFSRLRTRGSKSALLKSSSHSVAKHELTAPTCWEPCSLIPHVSIGVVQLFWTSSLLVEIPLSPLPALPLAVRNQPFSNHRPTQL